MGDGHVTVVRAAPLGGLFLAGGALADGGHDVTAEIGTTMKRISLT